MNKTDDIFTLRKISLLYVVIMQQNTLSGHPNCMTTLSYWYSYFFCQIYTVHTAQPARLYEPAVYQQLEKMHLALKPHGTFGSYFSYLSILALSRHWYAKRLQGFAEYHLGRFMSFIENAHISGTARYILINFCILIHLNMV